MEDPAHLVSKADKKAASNNSFLSAMSAIFGTNKYDDAIDLYQQAANAFRLQKQNKEAGETFEKAAKLQLKTDEQDDAPNMLVEAYKCYKRDHPKEAARVLEDAIKMFSRRGNLRRAANYMNNLAELYEKDLDYPAGAIEAYEQAAEWFADDNAQAIANKSKLKAAELAALDGKYDRAINQFEEVAKASVGNPLTKWSTKDYFIKAGICHVSSGDLVAARRAIESYPTIDATFAGSKEDQFLQDILTAMEKGDSQEFTDKVYAFDQLTRLDNWKTTMLLRVKNQFAEEPDLT